MAVKMVVKRPLSRVNKVSPVFLKLLLSIPAVTRKIYSLQYLLYSLGSVVVKQTEQKNITHRR